MYFVQVFDTSQPEPRFRTVRAVWESRVGWCFLYPENGKLPEGFETAADATRIAQGLATSLPVRSAVLEMKSGVHVFDSLDWPHTVQPDPLGSVAEL